MKVINKKYLCGLLAISGGVLTGCATTNVDSTNEDAKKANNDAKGIIDQHTKTSRSGVQVEMSDDYHIVGKKFNKEDRQILPSFFRETYSFNRVDPVSFSDLVSYVNKETNVRLDLMDDAINHIASLSEQGEVSDENDIEFEEDVNNLDMSVNAGDLTSDSKSGLAGSDLLFTVEFSGTLEDFLNHILGRVNLSWEWKNNRIEIFHVTEKTFVIDGDFSDITFDASMTGGAGSTQTFGMSNEMGSMFADLESVIGGLMSSAGKMSISKHSSSVTVTDTPSRIEKISRYMDKVNDMAGKMIMMNIQIIDIESNDEGDYGIDWEMVYSNSSRMAAGLTTGFLPGPEGNFGVTSLDGGLAGSKAMVNALSRHRNASTSINSNIHTMNGRPVPFSIGQSEEYMNYEPRFNEETGEIIGLSPGDIESMDTGINLSLVPKITSNGDIALTMAMDISDGALVKEVMEGLPSNLVTINHKSFIQQALSKNGQSIMLTGFERTVNDASKSTLGEGVSWLAGGAKNGNKAKTMSVIVITPYIMK